MAFQLKSFASITASMINWMRAVQKIVTDFNVGSVVRSMLEAGAAEIDELYKQIFIGITEAIPVSIYTSFNFPPLAATPAGGLIPIVITAQAAPVLVAAGTLWVPNSGGVNYTQTANFVIAAGATTANIPVSAVQAGTIGNLAAGTLFNPTPVPTGFVSGSNVTAFINGLDAETPDNQKIRFNAYISTLARGTPAAIQFGLTTATLTDASGNVTERVATAQVVEPWKTDASQPVSLVRGYIYNGVGGTSVTLVARAQKVVDGFYDINNNPVPGWKAAGVQAVIAAVTEVPTNIAGVLTAKPGFDKPTLIGLATPALFAFMQQLVTGTDLLVSDLITLVKKIPGVSNIVFSAPTTDIAGVVGQKLTPGAITLT